MGNKIIFVLLAEIATFLWQAGFEMTNQVKIEKVCPLLQHSWGSSGGDLISEKINGTQSYLGLKNCDM